MIPITYAVIGFGLSSLVGAVLMLLFKAAYDRTAEKAETMTADDLAKLSAYFNSLSVQYEAAANRLRTPGK